MKKIMFIVAALFISTVVFSQSEPILCGAPTKAGHPCKNHVTEQGNHCYLHGGAIKNNIKTIAVQCSAVAKSTDRQCQNKTTNTSGLCHVHNK